MFFRLQYVNISHRNLNKLLQARIYMASITMDAKKSVPAPQCMHFFSFLIHQYFWIFYRFMHVVAVFEFITGSIFRFLCRMNNVTEPQRLVKCNNNKVKCTKSLFTKTCEKWASPKWSSMCCKQIETPAFR